MTFETKKGRLADRVNISVEAGDVMLLETDSPDRISEISAALLLEVGLKDMKKEVFLIDAFNEVIDEEIEEDENA